MHNLVGIPVHTKSGQALGKLADVLLDTDTGRIMFLEVRTPGLIHGLMNDILHVSWAQIISLDDKEAIVMDAVIPVSSGALAINPVPPTPLQQKTRES